MPANIKNENENAIRDVLGVGCICFEMATQGYVNPEDPVFSQFMDIIKSSTKEEGGTLKTIF